jgi:two-component system, NarL family, nitrate/nitrite response regulator NarL
MASRASDEVSVAVVGRDPLARSAITSALVESPGIRIAGDFATGAAELALLGELAPDVVVWDLGAGAPLDWDELAHVATRVVVVVLASEASDAARALGSGARGALARDSDGARLVAALAAAERGVFVVDEVFAPTVIARPAERSKADASGLTPREQQVLELVAQGRSNKRIAVELGISEHTVKFHLNAILEKLDVDTRTEAVVQAARLGWLFL